MNIKSVAGRKPCNRNVVKSGTGTQDVGNPVKVEGRGNTGKTTPNTLNENANASSNV